MFVKHPTKPSTYIPGRPKVHNVIAWSAVCVGAAILWYMAYLIARGI